MGEKSIDRARGRLEQLPPWHWWSNIRHQVDRSEVHMTQLARQQWMGWPQIAEAQGQRSPLSGTQRYRRLVTRVTEPDNGIPPGGPRV